MPSPELRLPIVVAPRTCAAHGSYVGILCPLCRTVVGPTIAVAPPPVTITPPAFERAAA